jgi:L-amino acid N-acyltransferase YncA
MMSAAPPWAEPFTADRDLLVRRAIADDLVELAALKRRIERCCYAHLASEAALAIRLHRRATAWWLVGRLAAGDLLLLAQVGGRTVGLGAARLDRDPDGAPRVHLHSGYVDGEVEEDGYGAGRALLTARLQAAEALGAATVTADAFVGATAATESAHRLRRLGMAQIAAPTESATFPGVPLSHWAGSVHTALDSLDRRRTA